MKKGNNRPSQNVTGLLDQVAKKVENRLLGFFEEIENAPPSPLFDTHAQSILLSQVKDLTLRGGKRIRSALLFAGAGLFDPNAMNKDAVLDAAAALELRQTYLLIHDDIMDGDTIRRGGPTVHVALAGFTGDKQLGEGLGILAGDLAQALEQVLLTGIDVDESILKQVLRIFATMHLDVVHGQTLDMLNDAPAFEVYMHKTASYTTVGPLITGAAIAGARETDVQHLAKIALPLGVAFQIRDDLIGTFGVTAHTGKPSNTDLLEGKKTVLIEEGRTRADSYQLTQIEQVVGNESATDEAVDTARQALVQCGAKSACEEHIQALTNEFIVALDKPYYNQTARTFLIDVAKYIAERDL